MPKYGGRRCCARAKAQERATIKFRLTMGLSGARIAAPRPLRASCRFVPGGIPVEEATQKAGVLIEALPYITSFRRKVVVVKLGGSVMDDEERMKALLTDIVFMEHVGMWPVLVHGGGPRISAAMKKAGIEPVWIDGLRYTDADTLRVACRVLVEDIGQEIIDRLDGCGGKGVSISGRNSDLLVARKRMAPGGEDLGFVGDIAGVDREICERLCIGGVIPVIAPIGRGTDGVLYNVNGDSAASAVASHMGASKLIFISDVPGILTDPDDDASMLSSATRSEIDLLIDDGKISGGMLPKVSAGLAAIDGGVSKVHIVSGLMKHALLLEMFTRKGVGTQIVPD